jgi:hypothetical protein
MTTRVETTVTPQVTTDPAIIIFHVKLIVEESTSHVINNVKVWPYMLPQQDTNPHVLQRYELVGSFERHNLATNQRDDCWFEASVEVPVVHTPSRIIAQKVTGDILAQFTA